jgi:hypothetical protein
MLQAVFVALQQFMARRPALIKRTLLSVVSVLIMYKLYFALRGHSKRTKAKPPSRRSDRQGGGTVKGGLFYVS